MGKKRKIKSAAGDLVTASALPLDAQIEREKTVKAKKGRFQTVETAEKDNDAYINEKLSSKILTMARKQREHEEFKPSDKQPK